MLFSIISTIFSAFSLIISVIVAIFQYLDRKIKISVPLVYRSLGTEMSSNLVNVSKFAINLNNQSARSMGVYAINFVGINQQPYAVDYLSLTDSVTHKHEAFSGNIGEKNVSFTRTFDEQPIRTENPIFSLKPYESKLRFFEIDNIPESIEIKQIEIFTTRRSKPFTIAVKQELISIKKWQQLRQ